MVDQGSPKALMGVRFPPALQRGLHPAAREQLGPKLLFPVRIRADLQPLTDISMGCTINV
jgi:hypothetical protein